MGLIKQASFALIVNANRSQTAQALVACQDGKNSFLSCTKSQSDYALPDRQYSSC